MRKLNKAVAAVATLAIAASMAAPAFAAVGDSSTIPTIPKQEIKASMTAPTPVYNVNVEWKGLSFTYNAGEWNTEELKYEAGTTSSSVGWNNQEDHYIKVTNKSNAALTATVTAKITHDTDNIKVSVADKEAGISSSAEYSLASADANIKGDVTTGTSTTTNEVKLALSGRPAASMDKITIGEATVTLK